MTALIYTTSWDTIEQAADAFGQFPAMRKDKQEMTSQFPLDLT
ncbi:hypothetical protein WOC76_00150 [Methylocystis sp. IM3]